MKCYINGIQTNIDYTAVLPPPYNGMKKCRFVICDICDTLDCEIDFEKTITSAVIRPLSLGISCRINGSKLSFKLDKPCNISVEINGGTDDTLFIFANESKEYDLSGYKNIIRFEKGIHDIDEMKITDNSTAVIFDEGAVVNGRLVADGVDGLKICGKGSITMKNYTRGLPEEMTRCVEILNCRNIVAEDFCILDSCNWSFRLNGCDDAEISNIKIIGCRGNSDGIDVCGSRNIHITGCFVRAYDDGFVVKGFDTGNVENVVFEKSTLWNDMARPIEVGVELRCETVKNVIFRDIDVIHSLTCYPIFGIHHGDRAVLSDIHYENIRVENAPGAQLFDFRITDSMWNTDTKKGRIENIYVNNIRLVGDEGKDFRTLRARIDGYSKESNIKNVHIGKIYAFGKDVSNLDMLGLETVGYVENVIFDCPKETEMLKSKIEIADEFKLESDGKYHGKLRLTVKNMTAETACGEAEICIFPKNKPIYNAEKLIYSLNPGETAYKDYDVTASAGKLAAESRANDILFRSDVEYINLPYVFSETTDSAAPVKFDNCYGDCYGEVRFAVKNGWLEVRSELLKNYAIMLYAAEPAEREDNQILFSVEESYFGEAPSVKWKNNRYMSAPEIGNHWEITHVFRNNPKVKQIKKVGAPKNLDGMIKIPLSNFGLPNDTEHFWLEAELVKPTEYEMPVTAFRSTFPEMTAHMFCDFVKKK